ncbi:hypothetical protein CNYM01_13815 [Colletotrichum nymphaeae SA-01]|uniref:C2H2-type domain-containing protein n=1 Tax=Colletotrichum nymphaeae SA-01 TaxID=1460502 RepID=A0A135SI59_9PEZI|nr:hypothetical protein CNYM01_13815 [Colletotrichum nymphaeae SA-01]
MSTESAETKSLPDFSCKEPGCELKTFSTRSNLNRHNKSKHGQQVQMPCGKSLQNHVSNCRRHKDSCQRCRAAVIQHLTPDERTNVGSPVNANEMPIYDYTFEVHPASLGDMAYSLDDFYFEAHQSGDHLFDCKI